ARAAICLTQDASMSRRGPDRRRCAACTRQAPGSSGPSSAKAAAAARWCAMREDQAKSAAKTRHRGLALSPQGGRTDMDVGIWLGSLGLDQYAALIRENEIEADLLPELTDQDLSDLGIPLGHRLRMLRAIRELVGAAETAAKGLRQDTAERRQLTIMFCDL